MGKIEHIKKCQQTMKEHPALRWPVMAYMFMYLIFYHLGRKLMSMLPKVCIVILCLVAFVVNTSFDIKAAMIASAKEKKAKNVYEIAEEDLKVMLESDEGDIEAKQLIMSEMSATMEDVEAASKQNIIVETINVDPGMVAEDTIIYDEENDDYVLPQFSDDWSLILVNKQNLIPEDYEVELATIRGNIKADVRIVDKVLDMIEAAKDDGVYISICSPYRDYERQVMLFNRKMRSYTARGYSKDEAYELASNTVAIPGTSEHQLGLAFDFISNDYTSLDEGFENTDAGRWLKEHGAEYGFILRYPKNKVDITDIQFEPWHYRYVGDAAKYIMENDLCLEEYVEQIGMME